MSALIPIDLLKLIWDFLYAVSCADVIKEGQGGWNIYAVLVIACVSAFATISLVKRNRNRFRHGNIIALFLRYACLTVVTAWAFQAAAIDLTGIFTIIAWNGNLNAYLWYVTIPIKTASGLFQFVIDARMLMVIFTIVFLYIAYMLERDNINFHSRWFIILFLTQIFISSMLAVFGGGRSHRQGDPVYRVVAFWSFYIPQYTLYGYCYLRLWKVSRAHFKRLAGLKL